MTLEDLDRTIYEHIRLEVVRLGYLPDVTLYATPELYRNALESLQQTLKFKQIIDVLGVGAENSRDDKRPNRIIIDRLTITQGSLGSYGVTDFEKQPDDSFTKSQRNYSTQDIQYNVRCISNSAHYDRVLNQIIINVYNRLNYKKVLENGILTDDEILITQTDARDVSSTDLLEKLFIYTVEDVYIGDDTTIGTDISGITEIDTNVEPKLDISDKGLSNTDPELEVRT